jgi:lipopolysaccharide export system protein LptA
LYLSASDAELTAADLLVRFNEAEGRVEHMRIESGGKLVLSQQVDEGRSGLPGMDTAAEQKVTLADLIRATLEKRLAQKSAEQERLAAQAEEPVKTEEFAESTASIEGEPPPFEPPSEERTSTRPPVKYFARFEKEIDATRFLGDAVVSRLQADALEILRDFKLEGQQQADEQMGETGSEEGLHGTRPLALERIVLDWGGLLVVDAVDRDDQRVAEVDRAKITAIGIEEPVRVSHREGGTDATCQRLTLEPDDDQAMLYGSEEYPAVVRSVDHGMMIGTEIVSMRDGDRMRATVKGPGKLLHHVDETAAPASGGEGGENGTVIEFNEQLELWGRFETRAKWDFTGTATQKEARILERAVFTGGVEMHQDDTFIGADTITTYMGESRGGSEGAPTLERLVGEGNVLMTQGANRLDCEEIDVLLSNSRNGKITPLRATAKRNVTAVQGERTITAKKELIVDFETVQRAAPPFDVLQEHAKAVKAGEDITRIDWQERRRILESSEQTVPGVKRLQASGDVMIEEPPEALELLAEELDCSLVEGDRIDKATVIGPEDRPASVRLGTMSVQGNRIGLDVPNQWAEVPGAGGMTFQSKKDLSGRKLREPIPIKVEWRDRMLYQGRENVARFEGRVKAVSKENTTFECDRMRVEFDEVQEQTDAREASDLWIFQGLLDRVRSKDGKNEVLARPEGFSKEPAFLFADGNAKIQTTELDPSTGALKSRVSLWGPTLSVNLRKGASKLVIEDPGNLLLEDFVASSPDRKATDSVGLLEIDQGAGPSITMVSWQDLMIYDFSIDQTRFEGNATLQHLSGEYYELLRDSKGIRPGEKLAGRQTFLKGDVLTIDFLQRSKRTRLDDTRLGRISAERLRQFQADGSVSLEDSTEGIWLNADHLTYERERELLDLRGQPAQITKLDERGNPTTVQTEIITYDLKTNQAHGRDIRIQGR